jgi:3-oxoacyl-[acyl-carrier protein] reductase
MIVFYVSLDEKKAQAVVDEITKAGGDALPVSGDVGADDFPEKVLGATIKYISSNHPF